MGKFNFLLRKKKVLFLSSALATILIVSSLSFVNAESPMYVLGQQHKMLENSNDNTTVATVDNTPITKEGLEIYRASLNMNRSAQDKLSDQQVLDIITKRQSLYDQAIKNNITVSDDYVNQMIQSAKDIISKSPELKQQFNDYLSGVQLSENKYWEKAKPAYKKALIIGKYLSLNQSKDTSVKNTSNNTPQNPADIASQHFPDNATITPFK